MIPKLDQYRPGQQLHLSALLNDKLQMEIVLLKEMRKACPLAQKEERQESRIGNLNIETMTGKGRMFVDVM